MHHGHSASTDNVADQIMFQIVIWQPAEYREYIRDDFA